MGARNSSVTKKAGTVESPKLNFFDINIENVYIRWTYR